MSKQVTISRWFFWVFVLVVGWSLFKTYYVIPQAERRAFECGYTIALFDVHNKTGLQPPAMGARDYTRAEIDSILEARE